ncbi:HAD family phosphatase [Niveibacterium umoris]|uniref:HAD superfamily hydrolase (TIGR01509 family) n=1 Tax=Niveibacterium umoris TaxID=1193620 RepID=A0A840BF88_9RHOO|nr:HAD family phosphatase [Niveibacterium umoris]MBB4011835.1 HAD superfamily hydrolase (TIGR01509 family) [Niveibacterium umoris]
MSFPFKAVLFDMDGTITDSTALHDAAWDAFARAHLGSGLAPGDPRLVPGRTLDVVRAVLGRHVEGDEAQRLHDDKEQRFHAIARGRMRPIDGLRDYLEWLAGQGVATALVTNAPRMNIDFSLQELGLIDAFGITLGAEDVVRGKPHPDPFIEACRRLGVAPREALVHEDSQLGIKAGVAAGAAVAAILSGMSADAAQASGARWVTEDYVAWMAQIPMLAV